MRPTCLRASAAEPWREAEVPWTRHRHPPGKAMGTGKERPDAWGRGPASCLDGAKFRPDAEERGQAGPGHRLRRDKDRSSATQRASRLPSRDAMGPSSAGSGGREVRGPPGPPRSGGAGGGASRRLGPAGNRADPGRGERVPRAAPGPRRAADARAAHGERA